MIGVEKCGLLYMGNKDTAHVGFPEVAFDRYAEVLVNLVSKCFLFLFVLWFEILLICNQYTMAEITPI